MPITPRQERAVASLLDQRGARFRRQDLAEVLYPSTRPRSREVASDLAAEVLRQLARKGVVVKAGHVHWRLVERHRTLMDGRTVPELPEPVTITLKATTRTPDKWLLVDQETGERWRAMPNGAWTRAEPEAKTRG
ncbi:MULTISPECIES: hypothetical protein [unclassified Rhodanobacter]|uniref:hypothetical protein n=1 Tax=unclassified Rhodanobacter TaxID=2621553 RepID=UPI0007AA389B|nr:hypothetical protein [Rhodanobacter sp. FW510-R10]KZC32628.1 hypothetical protein RhoFW510R10_11990 [Rhodanobacter sp. FW510-R10]